MSEVRSAGGAGTAPVIGISAYREQAHWGSWEVEAVVLPWRYPDRVAEAGGLPVLLPPVPAIADVIDRLDGLILSGGGDVDPAGYGAEPHPETTSVRPHRDAAEAALLAAALARDRGHAPVPGVYGAHPVRVAAGSGLAGILGRTQVDKVPSHHHQALDRLGEGLTAVAWADDGLIEAVELDAPGCPFAVAVQWHPEAGDDLSLFRALIAAAAPRAPATALAP